MKRFTRVTFSVGEDGEIGFAPHSGDELQVSLRFHDTTVQLCLTLAQVKAAQECLSDFAAIRLAPKGGVAESGCYACWVEDGVMGHTPDVPHPVDKVKHTCGMVPRRFIVHCGICRSMVWVDERTDVQLFEGWPGRVPSGWGVWVRERCYVCDKCCVRPEWEVNGHEHELMRSKKERGRT